jgi:hypothetical protein
MALKARPGAATSLDQKLKLCAQSQDQRLIADECRRVAVTLTRLGLIKNAAINRTKSKVIFKLFGTRWAYLHYKLLVLADVNYGGENSCI